jgi:tetratricopeptide (TPR) repeat protein
MAETGHFDKLFEKAQEAAKRRNYDYAIDLYMQFLNVNPDHEEAARQIRAVTVRKGQEEGISPKAGLFRGFSSRIRSRLKELTKNYEEEITACEKFLRRAPFNVKMMIRLGNAALSAGHLRRALVNFEMAAEIDKRNAEALKALGRIYKELGEMKKAALCFEKVLAINPHDSEAARARKDIAATTTVTRIESMGDSYRDKLKSAGETAKLEIEGHVVRSKEDALKAIEAKKGEIQQKPNDSRLYRDLGDLYLRIDDLPQTESSYRKALEINPTDFHAKDKLSDLEMRKSDYKIQQLATAYREGPTEEKKRALDAARKEKLDFQIQEYERRVEERPTDTELRFRLGKFFFQAGRDDKAIGELQKIVHDPKNAVEAHHFVALAFRKKGMYELAVKELFKARERLPVMNDTNKEITYELARTFELMNKKNEAKVEYQKIAEADYSFKDVAQRLAQL